MNKSKTVTTIATAFKGNEDAINQHLAMFVLPGSTEVDELDKALESDNLGLSLKLLVQTYVTVVKLTALSLNV